MLTGIARPIALVSIVTLLALAAALATAINFASADPGQECVGNTCPSDPYADPQPSYGVVVTPKDVGRAIMGGAFFEAVKRAVTEFFDNASALQCWPPPPLGNPHFDCD